MAPGNDDDLPDKEIFETDWPIPEEIGYTSSSEEDDSDICGTLKRKRPRLQKPWCDLLFPKARIDNNPSVLQGMQPELELELRRYLADTVLTLVQKLGLSLDTFSVAVMFMHRFLMYRPVQTVDKRKLSLACVFLASKSTEDGRPPIGKFVCTFYRLCYHRELNIPTDQNVYERLKQELLFWESQILLVLGFNMSCNLREIRREIDVFCEEQAHIPKSILRSALCVFVLNTLALTTIPVRCSYRLIYLVSISLTLAWAKQVEPRDSNSGKIWWQYFCVPNQPTVEYFESVKAEILRCFESTKTKFHDYFEKRKSSSSRINSAAKNASHAANLPSGSSHQPSQVSNGDVEGLTGMPIIPISHQNGVGVAGSSNSSNERSLSHDNASYHRQSQNYPQLNRSYDNNRDVSDSSAHQHTRVRGENASSTSSISAHKYHKHYHRERSERPEHSSSSAAEQRPEHRHRKERRSGDKGHRRHSRSSHRREVLPDPRGDTATTSVETPTNSASASYPWDQSHHGHSKSASKRSYFSTVS